MSGTEAGGPNTASTDSSGSMSREEHASERRDIAIGLPFVVRSWWLRELEESSDLTWRNEPYTTAPLWSAFSDPLCDMAGLDYAYDLDDE